MDIKKLTDIAFIIALGLTPLVWFKEGYTALAGFDFAVYLDPIGTVRKSLYLWSDLMAGGYDISHEISSLPYYLLFALPVVSGASFYAAEKIVFVTIFMLQGMAMYYMAGALFEREPFRRKAALFGAVFYAFSYPVMAHFGRGNMMALLTYGLLPILIGLLYRGFTRPEKGRRYIVLIALLSIPVSATKGHPADFVVLVAVSVFFTLFHILFGGGRWRTALFAGKAALASFAVNLWWIIPNIIYISDFGLGRKDLVREGFYNIDLINYYSGGVSVLNMFRNERLNLWFDTPKDVLLNPEIYQTPLFIAVGIILAVTAYASLLKKGRDKNLVFFSLIGLAAVFLGKGTQAPFGWTYSWMATHVPGFFLFRAPYRIFSSLFLFSMVPLLAYGTGRMVQKIVFEKHGAQHWLIVSPSRLKSVLRVSFAGVLGACAILYAWPSLTGAHMKEKGTMREPGIFNNIPEGYFEAGRWAKTENHGKVYYPYEVYDFNARWGYNGPDPSFELLDAPKVVSRPGGTVYIRYQKPIEALNRVFREFRYGDIGKVLGVYNIRYPVLHNDVSPWVLPDYNFNNYASALLEESGMKIKKNSGELMFYENEKALPRIYQASMGYILAGDEGALPALSETGFLDAPFLMMARDIDTEGDAVEKALLNASGIVFHNSNLTDALCDSFDKKHGYVPKGERLMFNADISGDYEVYIKGAVDKIASIDSAQFAADKRGDDGFRWKSAGVKTFTRGTHEFAFKAGGQGPEMVIIPRNESKVFRAGFIKRMEEPGFDVVYLFDGVKGPAQFTLGKESEYITQKLAPVVYEREQRSLSDKGQDPDNNGWRSFVMDGTGSSAIKNGRVQVRPQSKRFHLRLSKRFDPVDLGYYPEMKVDELFRENKDGIDAGVSLIVGLEQGKLAVLKLDKDKFAGRPFLNIKDQAREAFGDSAVHELRTLIIDVTIDRAAAREDVSFAIPEFRGAFGVVRKGCAGDGAGRLGKSDNSWSSYDGNRCQFTKETALKPGAYNAETIVEGRGTLTMIRKKTVMKEPASGSLEFKRLSPARYVVKAAKPQPSSLLVFSDSYNRNWSLYANGKRYEPVKVNGFANGFRIDEPEWQELTLEYRPQRAFEYSAAASGVSLAGLLVFGAITQGRKK